jgi:CBS domain-containing protein
MNPTKTIHAKDLMTTEVVRLDASTPIESAIETLDELDISGAPVTDEEGRLLGILSTRDVTRAEHVRSGRIEANRGDFSMGEMTGAEDEGDANEAALFAREDFSPMVAGSDTVADWMNRRVITVDPDESLSQVCRRMYEEHAHRVIVTRDGRVAGIITSSDVVRYVAGDNAH